MIINRKSITLMCIILIQICVIMTVVIKIQGYDGILLYKNLKQKLVFLKEKDSRITEKNNLLTKEINFLQQEDSMDEYAREKMSMVGENELFFLKE